MGMVGSIYNWRRKNNGEGYLESMEFILADNLLLSVGLLINGLCINK